MSGRDDYPEGYAGPAINYSLSYGGQSAPAGPGPQAIPSIYNVEAEAALLGAMMLANKMIPLVSERVGEGDFFDPLHGRIFRAIVKLHDRGREASPVLLRPIFESDPEIAEVGGPKYLAQLTGSNAAIIGILDFADQVAELAVRRKVIESMIEGCNRLADPTADDGLEEIEAVLANVEDAAASAMVRSASLKPRSSASAIKRVIERQAEILESDEPLGAACHSVTDLDSIIGPAEAGTYNVIGGRPGMCKTTLACSAAWGYAANGAPTEYFHAEMTDDQLAMRHAADLSHAMRTPILHQKIRKGTLNERELEELAAVHAMAETLPLNFTATGACDIRRVESAVARAALRWRNRGRPLKIVWIDYIQKYKATDERGRKVTDPTEAASIVSETCARIAQRNGVAVFALAMLGRAVDAEKDHRPAMHHLKQSGKIEEDADSVTLLFRPEYYLAKEKPKDPTSKAFVDWKTEMGCVEGQLEMIGEKNRHGRPRTRTVKFIAPQYAIRSGDFLETDAALLSPGLFDDQDDSDTAEWIRGKA